MASIDTQSNLWTVPFTVNRMLEATNERIAWHSGRATYWKDTADGLKKDLEKSVEIVESTARMSAANTYRSTGDRRNGVSVNYDTHVEHELDAATTRFNYHMDKLREYEEWLAFFEAAPATASFNVDIAAVKLFRLGNYSKGVEAIMNGESGD